MSCAKMFHLCQTQRGYRSFAACTESLCALWQACMTPRHALVRRELLVPETMSLLSLAPHNSAELLEHVCQQMRPLPEASFDELNNWDWMCVAIGRIDWIEDRVRHSGQHTIQVPAARLSFDTAALASRYILPRPPSLREMLDHPDGIWASEALESVAEESAWTGDTRSVCEYVQKEIRVGRFRTHFYEWICGYSPEEKATRSLFSVRAKNPI